MAYWVAFTHGYGHKYACCFSEFNRIEKWLNAVTSCQNPIRTDGGTYDFHKELRDNFNVKNFDYHDSASKFVDNYLGLK